MSDTAKFDGGPVILGLVGIVLVAIGGCLAIGGMVAGIQWESTEGVVVDSEVSEYRTVSYSARHDSVTSTNRTNAKFQYRYHVNGMEYNSTGVDHGLLGWLTDLSDRVAVRKHPRGSQVTVYYDPSYPEHSVLWNGVPFEAPMEIGLGVILFLACWFWAGQQSKRRRSNSANDTTSDMQSGRMIAENWANSRQRKTT